MIKKFQPAYTPKHQGIDRDVLENKYKDLLAPIAQLKQERADAWDRWIWESGSQKDYDRVNELDNILETKQGLMGLFDQMLKPVDK